MIFFDIETGGLEYSSPFHCLSHAQLTTECKTLFEREEANELMLGWLTDPKASICGHNIISYDIPWMFHLKQVQIKCAIVDTRLLSILCYPLMRAHGLGHWGELIDFNKVEVSSEEFAEGNKYLMEKRCVQDVELTKRVFKACLKKTSSVLQLYNKELPYIRAMTEAQCLGVPFIAGDALNAESEVKKTLSAREDKWKGVIDNVGSSKQWSEYMVEKYPDLELPKTAKGNPQISKDTELMLCQKVPELEDHFEHKKDNKVLEFFDTSKKKKGKNRLWQYLEYSPETNQPHIFGGFNYYGTKTLRSAYKEPCLNQLKKGTHRKAIGILHPDYMLLGMDLVQLELAWLGYFLKTVCKDDTVWNEKINGLCPKKLTIKAYGEECFVNIEKDMWNDMAKKLNYAVCYGQGAYAGCLTFKLEPTDENILKFREGKEKRFPSMNAYTEILESQVVDGILRNFLGYYVRVTKDGEDYNTTLNTQMQSVGDGFGRYYFGFMMEELKRLDKRTRLILRNHDEIIVKVHKDFDKSVMPEIVKRVEDRVKALVPLVTTVDYRFGSTWDAIH